MFCEVLRMFGINLLTALTFFALDDKKPIEYISTPTFPFHIQLLHSFCYKFYGSAVFESRDKLR